MYEVRVKGEKSAVFKSDTALQSEMVAIALALASLYGTHRVYEVRRGLQIITSVSTETAFAAMQVKMRNLIFNRKITKRMPYRVESFTDLSRTKIVDAVKKKKSLDFVKDRLYTEVDEYERYTKNQLSSKET